MTGAWNIYFLSFAISPTRVNKLRHSTRCCFSAWKELSCFVHFHPGLDVCEDLLSSPFDSLFPVRRGANVGFEEWRVHKNREDHSDAKLEFKSELKQQQARSFATYFLICWTKREQTPCSNRERWHQGAAYGQMLLITLKWLKH